LLRYRLLAFEIFQMKGRSLVVGRGHGSIVKGAICSPSLVSLSTGELAETGYHSWLADPAASVSLTARQPHYYDISTGLQMSRPGVDFAVFLWTVSTNTSTESLSTFIHRLKIHLFSKSLTNLPGL